MILSCADRRKKNNRNYSIRDGGIIFLEIDSTVFIVYGSNREKQELKVLNIGTGPGFFAINLALAGNDVTAVDITDEMLSHAKENARAYQAKVHFSKQVADKLTFEYRSYPMFMVVAEKPL